MSELRRYALSGRHPDISERWRMTSIILYNPRG